MGERGVFRWMVIAFVLVVSLGVQIQATETMGGPGIVFLEGGVSLKALNPGVHEILLVLPQLTGSQVPTLFDVEVEPEASVTNYHYELEFRDQVNTVLHLWLRGDQGEVIRIHWRAHVPFHPTLHGRCSGPLPDRGPSSSCPETPFRPQKRSGFDSWNPGCRATPSLRLPRHKP